MKMVGGNSMEWIGGFQWRIHLVARDQIFLLTALFFLPREIISAAVFFNFLLCCGVFQDPVMTPNPERATLDTRCICPFVRSFVLALRLGVICPFCPCLFCAAVVLFVAVFAPSWMFFCCSGVAFFGWLLLGSVLVLLSFNPASVTGYPYPSILPPPLVALFTFSIAGDPNLVAGLLTDEEIIGINKDDIDEEDDESSTMEPPSRNEAIKAAITLNNFLLSYEKTTPEVLTMLRKIRDEIQGEIDFNKKQKTFESFFKKPS
ncbi:hypothetical protein LXL04_008775 [Taraxacum kok-saghyz]